MNILKRKKAPPKVGEKVFWRGHVMKISKLTAIGKDLIVRSLSLHTIRVDLKPDHVVKEHSVRVPKPAYQIDQNARELVWNTEWKMWYGPGTEGINTPKTVRGKLQIPPAPKSWKDEIEKGGK